MEAPGIEVIQEDGVDITRRRPSNGTKAEHQTRVMCRMCRKLFWVRTWVLINQRPGSCKPCGLIRSRRWGFGRF